jgi:hypothetical protein
MAANSLISDGVREQLREALAKLSQSVQLELVIRGASPDEILRGNQEVVRTLAEAIAAAAPDHIRLTLTDLDNGGTSATQDVPALLISDPGSMARIGKALPSNSPQTTTLPNVDDGRRINGTTRYSTLMREAGLELATLTLAR